MKSMQNSNDIYKLLKVERLYNAKYEVLYDSIKNKS